MGASVKITKNVFAELGAKAGNKAGVTANCAALNSQAKALCPIKYGQLRNSLMYQVFTSSGKGEEEGFNDSSKKPAPSEHKLNVPVSVRPGKVTGIQGTNSDHWYIEFGTRNMSAKPFERPAKEITLDGGKALAVAAKYQKDEMINAYRKKKTVEKTIG